MYKDKLITADEAVKLVKSNDHVVVGMTASEPQQFMHALHKIADNVEKVTVSSCLPILEAEFFMNPKYKETFNVGGWFYTNTLRKIHHQGNISFIPNHLHLAGKKRFQHMKPNIFAMSASMPDKHGFISLSVQNVYEIEAIELADIVIIEVNPNFPRTFGDNQVHISQVDYIIESNYPVPSIQNGEPNEKDLIIGKLIAKEIPDGACLQLGIGGIPNAVAASLMDKKNLGIHTEMFTNGMMDLIKAGVVNGMSKNYYKGRHVTAFAYGSKELYEFLDNNPSIYFMRGQEGNDPSIIGKNDNQVSINTTIEIDLTGQCASESIGHIQFSGTGGQSDTAVGAQNSKNGKSFITLYSTAWVTNKETNEKEEISKIVPFLKPGAAVSLSRNDVDYVVTEYGMVSLRGTTIHERAKLLISIAHPKFREQLTNEAKKLGYIGIS
ncbi:Propionyl-CoA:succinate CoA transferase [Acholeplasma oculi]|uniref:acetyl-CoA hydrolase/transferase family protein n=1 Tax=Acholeplasma oculi TaxID=35623 RepID=UPI000E1807A2|nr:acetyl-CoA hydrolase/transferase C-terminal domain-containing protein [Acholeplasma oculi]SUT89578.1 Propionyl-CoA:succinate CoA transferase [Acholeplasma oculi]